MIVRTCTVALWMLAAAELAGAQSVSPFVIPSVGVSRTHIAAGGGASLPTEASGSGVTFGAAAGVRVTDVFSVAGEWSYGLPFATVQTRGGVGRCCATLNRDHQLSFYSGVLKARLLPSLVLVAGGGVARNVIDEEEIFIDRFSPQGPQPPVTTNTSFDVVSAALVFGLETPIQLRDSLALVPAVRVFRAGNIAGQYADGWTMRFTAGIQFGR